MLVSLRPVGGEGMGVGTRLGGFEGLSSAANDELPFIFPTPRNPGLEGIAAFNSELTWGAVSKAAGNLVVNT